MITGEAGGEEFGLLQQRIHPAASRIERLGAEIPARFAAFDLLAATDARLLDAPFASAAPGSEARRSTRWRPRLDPERARGVAAHGGGRHREGARTRRTGPASARAWSRSSACARSTAWSWAGGRGSDEGTVGSLILGLYDGGELRPVGHCAGFPPGASGRCARAGAVRDRRARQRRRQPLGRRPRPGVGRAAARSWWPRSATTTPATGASGTGRGCCASATTANPRSAPFDQLDGGG